MVTGTKTTTLMISLQCQHLLLIGLGCRRGNVMVEIFGLKPYGDHSPHWVPVIEFCPDMSTVSMDTVASAAHTASSIAC